MPDGLEETSAGNSGSITRGINRVEPGGQDKCQDYYFLCGPNLIFTRSSARTTLESKQGEDGTKWAW